MLRLALLSLFWGGGVLAQQSHAIGEFYYVGCVEISAAAAREIPLDPKTCTPEVCQDFCTGYAYAAVYPTSCKCYNNVAEPGLPEEKCDNWCDGNSDLGRCGSCKNDRYSNLYSCEVSSVPAPMPQATTTIVIPPYLPSAPVPTPAEQPETSTSCVTIISTPAAPPPPLSPAGPVSYGPQTQTILVQKTSTRTSTTKSTWTSTTTGTTTTTSTSYSSKPGYAVPAQPSAPAPKVPPGYGDGVNPQGTSVVTPPMYGSGVVPATANPGYTSTKSGAPPRSKTISTGTEGATDTEEAEAGAVAVQRSLFAVVLALGIAAA